MLGGVMKNKLLFLVILIGLLPISSSYADSSEFVLPDFKPMPQLEPAPEGPPSWVPEFPEDNKFSDGTLKYERKIIEGPEGEPDPDF